MDIFGKGLAKHVHCREKLEILETSQSVESKGEADHFLELSGAKTVRVIKTQAFAIQLRLRLEDAAI